MPVHAAKTSLDRVLAITPPAIAQDFQGTQLEIYNRALYQEAGIYVDFVQEDISISPRHVLRGIHGDGNTWKLVSCLRGSFYLVVVNWDKTSDQQGRWESFVLSGQNRLQILIPPKCGTGFLVLSEQAIFHYKQSAYYDQESQFTLFWNDPDLDIQWPVQPLILSQRDEGPAMVPVVNNVEDN